jgi:hypothetical protein
MEAEALAARPQTEQPWSGRKSSRAQADKAALRDGMATRTNGPSDLGSVWTLRTRRSVSVPLSQVCPCASAPRLAPWRVPLPACSA